MKVLPQEIRVAACGQKLSISGDEEHGPGFPGPRLGYHVVDD